jgi:hypothetical protein
MLPFILVGLGIFYGLTLHPAWKIMEARHWRELPCVVDSSQVVVHSGDDGSTYSVEVVYRYFYDGREYTSNRYDFSVGSTGARKGKEAIVARHPAGTETRCFVNPDQPTEAVLHRGWAQTMFFGAFGLLFTAAGGFGLFFIGGSTRGIRPREPLPETDGPAPLKPKQTPLAKFLTITAFAAFWNGFIGIFVYFVFLAEDAKNVPFFAKAIVSLFALIGVALIIGVLGDFLALFNPRIQLTALRTRVPLGGELQFSWKIGGQSGSLRKLRFVLEGREEVTYRRGTSTSMESKVFAEIPVFETTERELLTQGSARVVVPASLMHSFESGNNKVLWQLKVQGEIPRWPDVTGEYPITVLPLPRPA